MKKINNYNLYTLILIVFILNTILFRSIDITKAQWKGPTAAPSGQLTNIVVNPLQENLDLGDQSITGDGNIDIDGDISSSGSICNNNGCLGEINEEVSVIGEVLGDYSDRPGDATWILKQLIEHEPKSKETDIMNSLSTLKNKLKRKSVIYIISDFISDEYEKPLKFLKIHHDEQKLNHCFLSLHYTLIHK